MQEIEKNLLLKELKLDFKDVKDLLFFMLINKINFSIKNEIFSFNDEDFENLKNQVKKDFIKKEKSSKLIYRDLAEYLKVSEQAVKQYDKTKRNLMMLGLAEILNK